MANIKLKIFENLCFKCKEIIFNFLNEDERYKFFSNRRI